MFKLRMIVLETYNLCIIVVIELTLISLRHVIECTESLLLAPS